MASKGSDASAFADQARLDRLRDLDLDPGRRLPEFDELARLAALVAGVPTAYVNIVDSDAVWSLGQFPVESPDNTALVWPRPATLCARLLHAHADARLAIIGGGRNGAGGHGNLDLVADGNGLGKRYAGLDIPRLRAGCGRGELQCVAQPDLRLCPGGVASLRPQQDPLVMPRGGDERPTPGQLRRLLAHWPQRPAWCWEVLLLLGRRP